MIDYARSQGADKVSIHVGRKNAVPNRVAQKCSGRIVSQSTYTKRERINHEQLLIQNCIVT